MVTIGGTGMIHAICVQGKSHSLLGKECQDRIYIDQDEARRIIIIADGMGSYALSGDFAQYILPEVSSWCKTNEEMIFTSNNDAIRKSITTVIQANVNDFKKMAGSDDFGSTLIIIHQSFTYHEVAVLHVGDGAVLGIPKSNCPFATAISSPENYRNRTIPMEYTKHMKILRSNYDDYFALFAGTDGGMAPFINSDTNGFASTYVDNAIRRILKGEDDLKSLIKEEHYDNSDIQDDISLVVLNFNRIPSDRAERGFIKILSPDSIEVDENVLQPVQFALESDSEGNYRNEYNKVVESVNEQGEASKPIHQLQSTTDVLILEQDSLNNDMPSVYKQKRLAKRTEKKKNKLGLYILCTVCILLCLLSVTISSRAIEELQELRQEYTKINEEIDSLKKDLNEFVDQQERINDKLIESTDDNIINENSTGNPNKLLE